MKERNIFIKDFIDTVTYTKTLTDSVIAKILLGAINRDIDQFENRHLRRVKGKPITMKRIPGKR